MSVEMYDTIDVKKYGNYLFKYRNRLFLWNHLMIIKED
jgi:hypothetical protein